MFVLTNVENVVMGITEIAEKETETGNIKIGENQYIVGELVAGIHEIASVPEGVGSMKYCYTPADGFYQNPNWVEPEPMMEQKIELLQANMDYIAMNTGVKL